MLWNAISMTSLSLKHTSTRILRLKWKHIFCKYKRVKAGDAHYGHVLTCVLQTFSWNHSMGEGTTSLQHFVANQTYSKYKVALQPAPSAELTRQQLAGFCVSSTPFRGKSTLSPTLTGRRGLKTQLETNAFSTFLTQGLLLHKAPEQHCSFTESWN